MVLYGSAIGGTSTIIKSLIPGLKVVPAGAISWACEYATMSVLAPMAPFCSGLLGIRPKNPEIR